jgi:hypothetical protein
METIEIKANIEGSKADMSRVILIARNFGWTAQIENKEGVLIDNPETALENVNRNIAQYLNQLAENQQNYDDYKTIRTPCK